MNYSIKFEQNEKHLYAIVSGERNQGSTVNDTLDALAEIDTYASKFGLSKILIHWNLRGKTNRKYPLEVISAIENVPISKSHKIAIIFADQSAFKNNKVIEKLANVIGWKVKFFTREEQAQEWLLD